jgi:glucose-1-phosphatase
VRALYGYAQCIRQVTALDLLVQDDGLTAFAGSLSFRMIFLLDIGRVLLDFDFESSLTRLLPANIKNPKERINQILDQKDALEAGTISPEHFTSWALEILESPATASQFQQAWQQIFTINPPMWRCVRKLANDGHQLILFSNISALHWPWISHTYPDFSHFHGSILSFEIGYLKPQPEMYQHAIKKYKLDPALTIYIDDMPQNIAAGKKFGFYCWQYDLNNHQAFERWLEKTLYPQISS